MIMVGALSAFLGSALLCSADTLAEQLFAEGQWRQCRSECMRYLSAHPGNRSIQLTSLQVELRLGKDVTATLTTFADSPETPQELKCKASYELALTYLNANRPKEALDRLIYCFNNTESGKLFADATRQANTILNDNTDLEEQHPELISIIRTASKTWPKKRKVITTSTWLPANPAMLVIAFYRTQISPAIGARCSLYPSCSQYAVEALRKHPITGLGMTGDRMVREPDVVAAKDKPVVINNMIKYADPVSDHDFWMRKAVK